MRFMSEDRLASRLNILLGALFIPVAAILMLANGDAPWWAWITILGPPAILIVLGFTLFPRLQRVAERRRKRRRS